MNKSLSLSCLACAALLLAACSSTPDDQKAAPVDERSPLASSAGGPGSGTAGASGSNLSGSTIAPGSGVTSTSAPTTSQATPGGRADLRNPASILSKRSVFYDYDSFVVKDEFRPLVEAHGRYLRDNKSASVVVQGNTDERGSREYNLALGQKRAESVKRMLSLMGVQEAQVETVSFGEEKPRNPGTDETAWSENRRSDIVYKGE